MTPNASRRLRYRLLAATSLVCAGAALGQSYDAIGTPVAPGSVTIDNGSPGITNVTVNAPTAVINWKPSAGIDTTNNNVPIDIQTGGTATFSGASDFVVLNRFLPTDVTRAMRFNGTTTSLVNGSRGGTLWFYSPSGIILGSNANFNVGSLLLSSSDIAYNPDGTISSPGQAQFLGTATSDYFTAAGLIKLEPGATNPQITTDNYVAMFAPKIDQGGWVRAGGSVAYVAAQAGSLTFPASASGLFDVAITDGADLGELKHSGATVGTESAAARAVYLVAVPRNNAISMLLGGSIGYDQASSATTVGDTVVLSTTGQVTGLTSTALSNSGGSPDVNVVADRLNIYGNLRVTAPSFTWQNGPFGNFILGDANIQAEHASFYLPGESAFTVGGSLNVNAFRGTAGGERTGGTFYMETGGATSINIGRSFTIDASSKGGSTSSAGFQGLGGNITMLLGQNTGFQVGTADVLGDQNLTINADGTGGTGRFGGSGQGGTIDIDWSGVFVGVPGNVTVSASGFGGPAAIPSPVPQPAPTDTFARAGTGYGGTIDFKTNSPNFGNTNIFVDGTLKLSATGTGGTATAGLGKAGGEEGGNGYGGTVTASLGGGLLSTTSLILETMGFGGKGGDSNGGDLRSATWVPRNAGSGGIGRAGDATLTLDPYAELEADYVTLDTRGIGGAGGNATRDAAFDPSDPNGNSGNGGNGGSGSGEKATLTVNSNAVLRRKTLTDGDGAITLNATATGGNGGSSASGTAGYGGSASGGEANAETIEGSIDTGVLTLNTFALGGNGQGNRAGGNATGGAATVSATGGGSGQAGISADQIFVDASGLHGRGGVLGTIGGQTLYASDYSSIVSGGSISLKADDASLQANLVDLRSLARQSNPANQLADRNTTGYVAPVNSYGIMAVGGAVDVLSDNNGYMGFGSFGIDTRAIAPDALDGAQNAYGGGITLKALNASAFSAASNSAFSTNAFGGSSFSSSQGAGNGYGGAISVIAGAVETSYGTVDLGQGIFYSGGYGGNANAGGLAGSATGGDLELRAGAGGTLSANGLYAYLTSYAGTGASALTEAGRGGNFLLTADSANFAIGNQLFVDTTAVGTTSYFNNEMQAGNIEISVSGDGETVSSSYAGSASGGVSLNNGSNGASEIGRTLISNTMTNNGGALELRGDLSASSGGYVNYDGVDEPSFRIVSDQGRIQVTGRADIITSAPLSIEANGDGGFDVFGQAKITSYGAPAFTITHTGNTNGVDTFFADDIDVYHSGSIVASPGSIVRGGTRLKLEAGYDLTADYLRAGDSLLAIAQHGMTVRDVAATDLTIGEDDYSDPTHGTVELRVADNPGQFVDKGALRIGYAADRNVPAVAGAISARGDITIKSGTSIYTEDGTTITAGTKLSLLAGDDIRLAGLGGSLTSGYETQIAANAAMIIAAGGLPTTADVDTPGNVRALIVDANLSTSGGGAITLSGDAIQADVSTITSSGDLTARLVNGDDGNGVGTGSTPTRDECGDGTICLGNFNVTGALTVGSNAAAQRPTLVRLRSDAQAGSMDVRAGAIVLGEAGIPMALTSLGDAKFVTTAGDLSSAGATISSNGKLSIDATGNVAGLTQLQSTGDFSLNATGNVSLGRTIVGGALISRSGPAVTIGGALNIGTLDTTSGNVDINAAGIDIGVLHVGSDNDVRLATSNFQDVTLGNVNAGANGRALNISVSGGNITAGALEAGGKITLDGRGNVRVSNDIAAGSVEAHGGSVDLYSLGSLNIVNGTTTAAAGSSGTFTAKAANGDLTAQSLDVANNLTLEAFGGALHLGNVVANGEFRGSSRDAIDFGHVNAGLTVLTSSAGGIAGGSIGGGAVNLRARDDIRITTNLSTGALDAQGASISVDASSDYTVANAVSTGGKIHLASAGSVTVQQANATGNFDAVAGGTLALGATTATGTLTGRGDLGVGFTTLKGSSVDLSSSNGGISGTTINTSGTTKLAGAGAVGVNSLTASAVDAIGRSVTLTSPGALNVTRVSATNGNALLTAANALTLNNTSAIGNIVATSQNGAVALNDVNASGSLTTRAQTGVSFGTVTGGTIDIESVNGDFNITNISSPGTIRLVTGGRITVSNSIAAGGGIVARGLNADLRNNTGTLNVSSVTATGGSISLTGRDGITATNVQGTGTLIGTSSSGAISLGTVNVGGQALLNGQGVGFGSITASSISIQGNSGAISGGTTVTSGTQQFMTTGTLTVNNLGAGNVSNASGSSVTLNGSGPVNIGSATSLSGEMQLTSSGALNIGSANAAGNLTARSFGAAVIANALRANGQANVNGASGVSFNSLTAGSMIVQGGSGAISGGTTTTSGTQYFRASGPVTIANLGTGAATAIGSSVSLTGSGGVNVANANATSGSVTIRSGGLANITAATATGDIDVATTNGNVFLGTVSASGLAKARATTGVSFGSITAQTADLATTGGGVGGNTLNTTGLATLAGPGALSVTALGTGAIDARGGSVALTGSGALNVMRASASAGNVTLLGGAPIKVTAADASGAIDVATTSGAVQLGTISAGGLVRARAVGGITFDSITGGTADLSTTNGPISGATLNTTGVATVATGGTITITALGTGAIDARASSVTLTGPGALNIARASASAGDVILRGGGAVNITTADATGAIDVATTNGASQLGTSSAGGQVKARATAGIGFANVTAQTADLATSGGGINGTTLNTSGLATLAAPGAVTVTNLGTGAIDARGGSVALTGAGALNIARASAAAGGVTLRAGSALNVTNADATGDFDAATTNGAVQIGNVTAGGQARARATAGLTFSSVASQTADLATSGGGINGTTLNTSGLAMLAAPGAITVTNLGTGAIDARGGSVALTGAGALNIARASAAAGDVVLRAGSAVAISAADATGAIDVATTNGAIQLGTSIAGGTVKAQATSGIGFTRVGGSSVQLATTGGNIAGDRIVSTGAVALNASGDVDVGTELTASGVTAQGANVRLRQTAGALNVTNVTATSGDVQLSASGNLGIAQATAARNFDAAAGGSLALGTTTAGGSVNGSGAQGVSFNAVKGTSVTLASNAGSIAGATISTPGTATFSANGAIAVTDLNAGNVDAVGRSVALTAPGNLVVARANATGGDATLTSQNGSVQITTASATGALTTRAATGIGFTTVSGGSVDLGTTAGNIAGDRIISTGAVTLNAGGDVDVATELTSTGATARGRNVRIRQTAGALNVTQAVATAGNVSLTAQGNLRANSVSATGDALLTSATGAVQLGNVTGTLVQGRAATGIGFGTISSRTADLVTSSGAIDGGTLNTTGMAILTAPGAVTVTALGAGATDARGASVALTGPGALNITRASAASGNVTLRGAGAVTITAADATGAVDVASSGGAVQLGTTTAGGLLKARAATGITFTRASGADIDLASTGGDIAGTRLGASGKIALDTVGAIAVTQVDGGAVSAHGSAIDLAATGALNVVDAQASAEGVTLRSGGDLTVGAAAARKFISATSTGGAVTVGDARISAPVGSLAQTAGTTPSAVTPSSGAVTISAATSATLNGIVSATGALDVSAASIALNGTASGGAATFRSGAITIGDSAAITSPGLVTFQNNGTQRTSIGGSSTAGYALTNAGLGRVHAGSIAIVAPSTGTTGQPDVTIGDLTLRGASSSAGNIGANGSFSVVTPGSIQVTGNVLLTDAGSGNTILLNGGNGIGITLPAGSLRVTDSAGALTGAIELAAPRIVAATAGAAADVTAAGTAAARAARLATNDTGTTSNTGAIAAGRLKFSVANGLYIQNTGGSERADRRGFTAGAGGVDIIATGQTPAEFVINGIVGSTSGDGVLAMLRLSGPISQTGSANFAAGSSANGCSIDQGCPQPPVVDPGTPPPPAPPPTIGVPAQDIVSIVEELGIEDPLVIESAAHPIIPPLQAPLIQLMPTQPFSIAPPVDEPVTGAGNDTLWTGVGVGSDDGSGPTGDAGANTGTSDGAPDDQ